MQSRFFKQMIFEFVRKKRYSQFDVWNTSFLIRLVRIILTDGNFKTSHILPQLIVKPEYQNEIIFPYSHFCSSATSRALNLLLPFLVPTNLERTVLNLKIENL